MEEQEDGCLTVLEKNGLGPAAAIAALYCEAAAACHVRQVLALTVLPRRGRAVWLHGVLALRSEVGVRLP